MLQQKTDQGTVGQILGILALIVLLNLQNTFTDESVVKESNLAQRQEYKAIFLVILKTQEMYHFICI